MIQSDDKGSAFEKAMRLPQGKYVTPDVAKISNQDAMLIEMFRVAKTSDKSAFPVIGTTSLATCAGIAIRNAKTKTAIIKHESALYTGAYLDLLKIIRSNPEERLVIDVVGAGKTQDNEDNQFRLSELNELVEAIALTPNATLRTFDVYDKPRPEGFALDVRNGTLIRGSEDMRAANTLTHKDFFKMWDSAGNNADFDGTQFPKKRTAQR